MIYKKSWKYILYRDRRSIYCDIIKSYRPRAVKNFSNIHKGDIGGLVKSYHNLSQKGDCWVYEKASIFGNAQVSGNAVITGVAIVTDNASVSGTTIIKDNTIICGDTIIDGDIKITGKNLKIQNNDDLQKILEIHPNHRRT